MIVRLYSLWRRVLGYPHDLQIWDVMRRQGIAREHTAGREHELVIAAHRCIACPSTRECDAALASDEPLELDAYCPNAAFVRFLRPSVARSRA